MELSENSLSDKTRDLKVSKIDKERDFNITEQFIKFVEEHANDDPVALRLKYSKGSKKKSEDLEVIDVDFAITQIEARKKSGKKLPSFLRHREFVFPTLLSSEQASNEIVARFHKTIIQGILDQTISKRKNRRDIIDQRITETENQRARVLDMTAGLGIDAMSFATIRTKTNEPEIHSTNELGNHCTNEPERHRTEEPEYRNIKVTACEMEGIKCDALRHNAEVIGIADNIEVIQVDSIEYLRNTENNFDVIFADPARRSGEGSRVHALADCQPDISEAMDLILKKGEHLIIKASPLLDLTIVRKTVKNLTRIHVVCFRGECKEVLMEIAKNQKYQGISVVDLDWDGTISTINFYGQEGQGHNSSTKEHGENRTKDPGKYNYLYEPNAGVMKTMAWDELRKTFPDLAKADKNTHIFLSDTLYSDFPGRIMEITGMVGKPEIKGFKGLHVNVVARNYPISAPQLEKKLGVRPGVDEYIYAFRWEGKPVMIKGKIIPMNHDRQ